MNLIHGATWEGGHRTRLYRIWQDMKNRCRNPNVRSFEHYGRRGIQVCEEWQEFIPFRDWALLNGYAENLTINRIDNDGNYCPENCNWLTKAENNRQRKMATGEMNHQAKLTETDVRTIRRVLRRGTRTPTQLGKDYEVSESSIRHIRDRKVWKHV